MGTPDKRFSDLFHAVKSLIPRRTEPANVSRDFWMPDHSCRVCYECDSQFTIFNRRHHCRLCGRVFCAKCTSNAVPVTSDEPKNAREDGERIRVCNYCFKQWETQVVAAGNGVHPSSPVLSPSLSTTSLASTKSSGTNNSSSMTVGSVSYSTGLYQQGPYGSGPSLSQSAQMEPYLDKQDMLTPKRNMDSMVDGQDTSCNHFGFCLNRSDDDDDEYGACRSDSEPRRLQNSDDYYGPVEFDEVDQGYGSNNVHPAEETVDAKDNCSSVCDNTELQSALGVDKMEELSLDNSDECNASSSIYGMKGVDAEPVDFENNGLLWFPPDPEDAEDDREATLFDDDDEEDATGEWGYLRSSTSFGSGDYRSRVRSSEEHRKAMKSILDGHFRALVAQLLQVENLPMGEEYGKESWLEIITSLSWEAATLLKPDTSKGGGMDPGGYVKVKCLASGRRSDSMAVKGIVCKKNVAHRRMASKIEKPRFLILGGALEYQRVTNLLSSFDTLLQQEMDHLKMAVAKIDAHHPNVLLVEKSVSRFAQDYLLAKNISLVLNIKRPLLERIARCTGAQIVPSIDHLLSPKLGHCDLFHVEKYFEEHGSAGQGGRKALKTLMFFEGCPKPLGCTILLKGANGDELKKVKHVVQYGVFAAYHLALETSFLADEGASLPELPLKSPITVALPDKPSSADRSISTIPGFTIPSAGKLQSGSDVQRTNTSDSNLTCGNFGKVEAVVSPYSYENLNSQTVKSASTYPPSIDVNDFHVESTNFIEHAFKPHSMDAFPTAMQLNACPGYSSSCAKSVRNKVGFMECVDRETVRTDDQPLTRDSTNPSSCHNSLETLERGGVVAENTQMDAEKMIKMQPGLSDLGTSYQDNSLRDEHICPMEEFLPSPSDHQSFLVSLSSRCVWKGTVCERAHLFRIKYYGNFDKPLGRFLRDHLFDQSYRCCSCEMPSEAHVHCYTHRQGSLTISVRKLTEFSLPGERDGKIWMWHRCLRCPRIDGLPPATRRVVMSDAAWGLSFGKFLELSFSNHAAASRVASCGHSLHRDCLRFYGFGRMVACFRYAPINLHSVYLPPPKLDFNYQHQEWVEKEVNEVAEAAELLFTEVLNALCQISERKPKTGSLDGNMKVSELRRAIVELEGILQKEKAEFEESIQKIMKKETRKGKPSIDILEVNKLRRQLLFQSYFWDQRLIYAAGSHNGRHEVLSGFMIRNKEKLNCTEKLVDFNTAPRLQRSFIRLETASPSSRGDESIVGSTCPTDHEEGLDHFNQPNVSQQKRNHEKANINGKRSNGNLATSINAGDQLDPLEPGLGVRRVVSDGQFPVMADLSDTLDAKWRGENGPALADASMSNGSASVEAETTVSVLEDSEEQSRADTTKLFASALPARWRDSSEDLSSSIKMPFVNFYRDINKNSGSAPRFGVLSEYNPLYVSSFRDLVCQGGARLLLPIGVNDTVIPIYDDEPTSIISYALVSPDYHFQMSEEWEKARDGGDTSFPLPNYDSENFQPFQSFDDASSENFKSFGSVDESILSLSGSRAPLVLDPVASTKAMHIRVSFGDDGPLGKAKYTVTCYYAKSFEALRRICCPSELGFVRSLSRCKKWGAQGGKSNVFFAKSLDDRFVIKQVTKTELESFIKFAPEYFKYLSESIKTGSPTCLAKILGIYQVTIKHLKGGKESRMDLLVMENLLFRRNVTRLYDLKGSSRSRYNPDSSGNNKVLLDQNLIEAMPTSPIFMGNKAKRLLERAVWNDTSFLASIDVMDYSLLVGVDEEKHELVLGIIDFMRQYTWDKHLETWVKASGFLGGPKNASPTVISPKQYKKRFRKAMSAYFLVVPDQWSPPAAIPGKSLSEQSDLGQDNVQGASQES
ncbi:1-phosphatidylinositol-3-phosphate 5-kinase FAB1A-like isoform X2 [Phoenix dactylifera]|uniref:1-phosphatidylinositol-3-phosphate 5-kinase n=1 Tax=Phoenix dactylifera TaxID=42345 RepID=A0A8B7CEF9_PHODC|nr:1-phosphatidylinositol-3-phosphate 5-kinase FAB1A-like isoform X2 [Phoenix dactylifera]